MAEWAWCGHLAVHPRLQSQLHLWGQLCALCVYQSLTSLGRCHRKCPWSGAWAVVWVQRDIKAADSLQRSQTEPDCDIWASTLWAKVDYSGLTWEFLSLSCSLVLLTEFGLWPGALASAASAFGFFLTAVCMFTLLLYQGTLCLLTKCFPTGNFLWWKTLGKLPVRGEAAGGR